MTRDSRRQQFYDTERAILALTDRPGGGSQTVEIAATRLTVPAQAKFSSVDDVQRYVDRVLAMPAVQENFPRAALPVHVRHRKGTRAAHYERMAAEIAVPTSENGRWAMRELVVLHELSHHLDPSGEPAHGQKFVDTLVELAAIVMGPEVGLVYRVLLTDAGLM